MRAKFGGVVLVLVCGLFACRPSAPQPGEVLVSRALDAFFAADVDAMFALASARERAHAPMTVDQREALRRYLFAPVMQGVERVGEVRFLDSPDGLEAAGIADYRFPGEGPRQAVGFAARDHGDGVAVPFLMFLTSAWTHREVRAAPYLVNSRPRALTLRAFRRDRARLEATGLRGFYVSSERRVLPFDALDRMFAEAAATEARQVAKRSGR